jgi:hypothetical protein
MNIYWLSYLSTTSAAHKAGVPVKSSPIEIKLEIPTEKNFFV